MPAKPSHLTVVLAEDDDGHALLVTKNIERAGLAARIVRLRDGLEALDYFRSSAPSDRSADRAVLLLDIDMPRLGGLEVLRKLRQDAATATLPIIMLTTTDDPQEVARCYHLGCNVYVRKPVVHADFADAIDRLAKFLQVIEVPTNVASGT